MNKNPTSYACEEYIKITTRWRLPEAAYSSTEFARVQKSLPTNNHSLQLPLSDHHCLFLCVFYLSVFMWMLIRAAHWGPEKLAMRWRGCGREEESTHSPMRLRPPTPSANHSCNTVSHELLGPQSEGHTLRRLSSSPRRRCLSIMSLSLCHSPAVPLWLFLSRKYSKHRSRRLAPGSLVLARPP